MNIYSNICTATYESMYMNGIINMYTNLLLYGLDQLKND